MPSSISPPRRRRRKDARPSELSAAALELFVVKGFAATRLEEIATLAGVSKGTLYLYFDGKEALFRAVIREGVVPMVDSAEALVAEHDGSAFELLSAILLGWWEKVGDSPLAGIPRLLVAEAQNFPEVARFYYEHVIRRARALIAEALRRGMESGEFRRMDIDTCIDVVIAPLMSLLVWRRGMAHCLENPPAEEAVLAAHLDILRQGLAVR